MSDADAKELPALRANTGPLKATPKAAVIARSIMPRSRRLHPSLAGIKIVDCDTHITEAPDLFTSRAPARYKDKVPYVKLDADGVERWVCGDRNFGSLAAMSSARTTTSCSAALLPRLEQAHPGGHLIKERLQRWTTWASMPRSATRTRASPRPAR